MLRQRRPRTAPRTPTRAKAADDDSDDRPPELIAAHEHAIELRQRHLNAPDDADLARKYQAAEQEFERLGEAWSNAQTEAFRAAHGGRTVVAVEELRPPPKLVPSPSKRLHGAAPTARARKSQRDTPGRDERERIAVKIGANPEVEHARIVDAQRTRLEDIRTSWPHIMEARAAIEKLRASVPAIAAVSEATRVEATTHVDALGNWADRIAPGHYRSPEDVWFPFASEELNDDEIAQVLSPGGVDSRKKRQTAMPTTPFLRAR